MVGGGGLEKGRQGEVGEGRMEGVEERREIWVEGGRSEKGRGSSNSVSVCRSHTCIILYIYTHFWGRISF